MWEQIISRALEAVGARDNVQYNRANETFTFVVGEVVAFRFKKADDDGLSGNVPTQTALAFHEHQLPLPGIPAIHRVEVVYQLDALATAIRDILVVARDGGSVHWSYSILTAAVATALTPAATTQTTPAKALVIPISTPASKKKV